MNAKGWKIVASVAFLAIIRLALFSSEVNMQLLMLFIYDNPEMACSLPLLLAYSYFYPYLYTRINEFVKKVQGIRGYRRERLVPEERKQKVEDKRIQEHVEAQHGYSHLREYLYKELEYATDKFRYMLGTEGQSYSVFKGSFDDRTQVVVKIVQKSEYGRWDFIREISAVSRIKHDHLARLLGYCTHTTKNGKSFFFLVYQFYDKGSLHSWIYQEGESSSLQCLSWEQRYSVAVNVAKAIAFLHQDCHPQILHLNVKPKNILLDSNYQAVLSDYGFPKLMSQDETTWNTVHDRPYKAPELVDSRNKVSKKCDIFSFGQILLDLITGKQLNAAGNHTFSIGSNLELELGNLIDMRLHGQVNEQEASFLLKVALQCLKDDPQERPTDMEQIVDWLELSMRIRKTELPPALENEDTDTPITETWSLPSFWKWTMSRSLLFYADKGAVPDSITSRKEMEKSENLASSTMFEPHIETPSSQCLCNEENQSQNVLKTEVDHHALVQMQAPQDFDGEIHEHLAPENYGTGSSSDLIDNSSYTALQVLDSVVAIDYALEKEKQLQEDDIVSQQILEGDRRGAYPPLGPGKPFEDGYKWRKYGQSPPLSLNIVDTDAAEALILQWNITSLPSDSFPLSQMIFSFDDRTEADRYLHAIDTIQATLSSSSTTTLSSYVSTKLNKAIQMAMARLEYEFRNILISHTNPIEANDPPSSVCSSTHHHHHDSISSINDSIFSSNSDVENSESSDDHNNSFTAEHLSQLNLIHQRSGNSDDDSHRSSSTSIHEIDLIPYETCDNLKNIAERMISSGYLRECIQVYASVRKSAIDSSFRRLGIEKLSIGDVQRLEWNALESKIRKWIRAAKVCVRILFASEKALCEQIFQNLSSSGDDVAANETGSVSPDEQCFMETVKGPAIQLFNLVEAISISRRSPEKLFKILDLYDALANLLPDVDSVFESKPSESIRIQAAEILSRLAEAARGILSEFENAVQREPSKVPVPGGTLHPLTRYVMNYISLISDYKQTLLELIVSEPSMRDSAVAAIDVPELESRSVLAIHLIWIMAILQFNLEDKSKHYKDLALAHIFMMNNIRHIVQKVKGSPELREMIGDDYLRKLTWKFRQAATSYQRATWIRILYCLRDEGLHVSGSFSSGVSKSALRERFKTFNSMLEEVHRTQSTWTIPDPDLREELRISISEKLIPAYRSFLGRFRGHIESGKHPELYIRYSAEDLETAVLDFFEGFQVTLLARKRSH